VVMRLTDDNTRHQRFNRHMDDHEVECPSGDGNSSMFLINDLELCGPTVYVNYPRSILDEPRFELRGTPTNLQTDPS
jgi:hypothetical protein